MIEKIGQLKEGYNTLTEMNGKHSDMLMDIGVYNMKAAQKEVCLDAEKESAFLLLTGKITIEWNGNKQEMERTSVFDEDPWCLHVPKNVEVKITAIEESDVLIEKTNNEKVFDCKLYSPEDCRSDIFGEGVWKDAARRVVRTVFDYSNAPYSNLVIGEVINFPGRWSSYIPHEHPQPEVYYYKFNKPQGFGCSIIGDEAYKIEDNSISVIPGGLVHPQVAAPGYAMYYCWMIRHLDNNPWTDRINAEEHKWLLDEGVKIWPEK